jgi:4-amino-4-deoxy-L-arabinose transferase-like glycosyltransferase
MKQKTNKILFFLILVIAFFLRFFVLAKLPAILNRDEAAIAYNAFLIKEAGMDEWQENFPLILKSFGDYKLPIYPYLTILNFFIFGINDWSVKLTSALAGFFLVIVSYYFSLNFKNNKKLALFFSFIVAISPIFVFYSRVAYEANVALLLIVLSLLLVFNKNVNWKKDLLALFLLTLAIFCYNTPLLLLPFFIIALFFCRLKKKKKLYNFSFVLSLSILFIFIFSFLFSLNKQKSNISFLLNKNDQILVNFRTKGKETHLFDFRNFQNITPIYSLNRIIFLLNILFFNLKNSFSFNFLVANGGSHPWHSIPGFGHIYLVTYLFLIFYLIKSVFYYFGILFKSIYLFYSKKLKKIEIDKHKILLDYLLFISLVPAIITVDAPHATRSLLFFYLLIYLSSSLIFEFSKKISSLKFKSKELNKWKRYFFHLFVLVFFFESFFYYKSYFFEFSKNQQIFQANFDSFIKNYHQDNYLKKTALVDPDGYQYVLLSWYLKVSPENFFSTIHKQLPNSIFLRYGDYVLNYHFIAKKEDLKNEETIIYFDNFESEWKLEYN